MDALAGEIERRFHAAHGATPLTEALLATTNLAPLLAPFAEAAAAPRMRGLREGWEEGLYRAVERFALALPSTSLAEANARFRAFAEEALASDWAAWRHELELARRRRDGVDCNQVRRYSADVMSRGERAEEEKRGLDVGAYAVGGNPLAGPSARARRTRRCGGRGWRNVKKRGSPTTLRSRARYLIFFFGGGDLLVRRVEDDFAGIFAVVRRCEVPISGS